MISHSHSSIHTKNFCRRGLKLVLAVWWLTDSCHSFFLWEQSSEVTGGFLNSITIGVVFFFRKNEQKLQEIKSLCTNIFLLWQQDFWWKFLNESQYLTKFWISVRKNNLTVYDIWRCQWQYFQRQWKETGILISSINIAHKSQYESCLFQVSLLTWLSY